MSYIILAIICLGVSLAIAVAAFRVLIHRNWLLGWLRGMFGLFLLALVFVAGAMAFDIYGYRQLQAEQNIATISFREIEPQYYSATFVEPSGKSRNFQLYGDQWQLDSRIIKWRGLLTQIGLKTGYRLDRISGRYLLLDDERTKKRSAYELSPSLAGVDVWRWLKESNSDAIVDARYGNSTFLPMVDGAQYQVSVSSSGLLARPMNEPAQRAVDQWQ